VASSYLLALIDARPSGPPLAAAWLGEMLATNLHARIAADGRGPCHLRGWSVGAVVGNETFVQARPIARDLATEPVDDLLRTQAPCLIASYHAATDDERFAETHPSIRIARFRRWVGARAETELDAETRRRLREEIPDFLARGQTLGNDGELVFLRFLSALHGLGALGSPFATPEQIRRALRTTEAMLGGGPVNMMVADGRTVGVVHRGGTLMAISPPAGLGARAAKPEDDARASRFNLLWFDPGAAPEAPPTGAERLAEGVFTIECQRPRTLARD
jgi:hypothetical protein